MARIPQFKVEFIDPDTMCVVEGINKEIELHLAVDTDYLGGYKIVAILREESSWKELIIRLKE